MAGAFSATKALAAFAGAWNGIEVVKSHEERICGGYELQGCLRGQLLAAGAENVLSETEALKSRNRRLDDVRMVA